MIFLQPIELLITLYEEEEKKQERNIMHEV